MPLVSRVHPTRFLALLRMPSAKPVYVLNVITYRNFRAYRIYGLLVLPCLFLARAWPPRWSGHPVEGIVGAPQCQAMLMVRYPHHQAFLKMIASPYYLWANRWRQRGVARFEASFSRTHVESKDALRTHRMLIGIHFNADDPRAAMHHHRDTLDALGCDEVLAIEEYQAMDFVTPAANDPNPLSYQCNQFFSLPATGLAQAHYDALAAFATSLPQCNIQRYARSSFSDYRPGAPVPDYFLP